MRMFTKASDGSIIVASYHPKNSITWHWAIYLKRGNGRSNRAERRTHQWYDYYRLPFGWQLIVARQDYHNDSK